MVLSLAQASCAPCCVRLGAEFIRQFQPLVPADATVIDQDMVGGSGLWLRAEPDEDRAQADALAAILAIGIRS